MTTGTIVLVVVVAVAAIMIAAGLVWLVRTKRNQFRQLNEQWDRANELDPDRGSLQSRVDVSTATKKWT